MFVVYVLRTKTGIVFGNMYGTDNNRKNIVQKLSDQIVSEQVAINMDQLSDPIVLKADNNNFKAWSSFRIYRR
jgi:hypothetical protein